MTDRHEYTVAFHLALLTRHNILENYAAHPFLLDTQHFINDRVPGELDLRVAERAFLHDLRGTQRIPAMNDSDLAGELREERSFLHRCVAASDDQDFLVLEEEPVTGGTRRHAVSHQCFFRFDAH